MEYVAGTNLRRLIESQELAAELSLQIIPQVCAALQFAHDEGIIHRDIKPENILVDSKARVKIADFGLAKLLGKTDVQDHTLTGTHQVMGTPRYMAPEQMEGSKTIDHRADIYSLGVVFYEMLTGEVPMGSFEPPSRKVQVDVRLDEIVLRSLAREPERRYQHASDVKTDVESVSASPVTTPPVTMPSREQRAGSFATPASGAYTTQEDGVRTAVLLILFFGSVLGFWLMFMPWSRVELTALAKLSPSAPEVGAIGSVEAAGYQHWLPFLGAMLSLVLFTFTIVKTIIGQFPSSPRAMLAAATGLLLALSGATILALSPLTNHPDNYAPVAKRYGFKVSDKNDAIANLLYAEQIPQTIDLRVAMNEPGPYLAMFVGVALLVASVLEMRLVLAPRPETLPPQPDELLRGPANALRWTAWASPLAIPVLIAMFVAYEAQTPSSGFMQFSTPAAEAALSVDSADKYHQYKILGALPPMQIVLLVLLVTQILHAIFVTPWLLSGASRMRQLRSPRFVRRTSIAAMLPLGVTFAVGVPVGIWSLIILAREEVTSAFDESDRAKRDEMSLERPAADQVLWPAIGLIFTGLLGCGLAITGFVLLATGVVKDVPWAEAAGALSPIFFVAIWAPTVLAGVFMLRRQAYGFVFAYSMLSIVFSLINLLGLPVGIWAITVLLQDDVKNSFGIKTNGSARAALPTKVKPPLREFDDDILDSTLSSVWTDWWRERGVLFTRSVQTVVMLLHIACLLAFLSLSSQATKNDDGQRKFTHEIGFPTPWFTVEATSDPGFSFHHAIHWSFSAWMVAVCGGGLAYVYCHIEKVRNPERGYWDKPQAFMLVWCILALADIGLGVSMGQLATNFNRTGGPTTQDAAGALDTNRQDKTGSDEVGTYDTPKIRKQ
jgi:hypothetical protein